MIIWLKIPKFKKDVEIIKIYNMVVYESLM